MRWQLATILGVWLALAPAVARAQPADPDGVKRGRAAFDAGREALKQGDLQGALAHFRTSLAAHVSPGTLLNLASVEEKLGLFASASSHYADALRLIPEADERTPIAKERIKAIEPRIPTIQVQLQSPPPPGLTMTLDGKELSTTGDIRADPGSHVLVLTAPGHLETRLDLTLQASQRQTVIVPPLSPRPETPAPTVTAAPTAAPAPTPTARPTAVPKPTSEPPSTGAPPLRTAGLVAVAIGGAAAIAGAVTGGLALSKKQELDAACTGQLPHSCPPDLKPVHAEGEALAHASTASLVAAGLGLAAGITLLVLPSPTRPKLAITPTGVVLRGRF